MVVLWHHGSWLDCQAVMIESWGFFHLVPSWYQTVVVDLCGCHFSWASLAYHRFRVFSLIVRLSQLGVWTQKGIKCRPYSVTQMGFLNRWKWTIEIGADGQKPPFSSGSFQPCLMKPEGTETYWGPQLWRLKLVRMQVPRQGWSQWPMGHSHAGHTGHSGHAGAAPQVGAPCQSHECYNNYHLVIKHGWLENPRTEWRFLARKITDFYSPFSSTPCWMNREGSSTHCIPSCGGHGVIPTKLARTARTPKK